MSQCIASLSSGRRMAKAEVLEVLGCRPFEATGSQAAGGSSFVFEVRTGEVKNTDTQFTNHLYTTHIWNEHLPFFIFFCGLGISMKHLWHRLRS